MSHKAERSFLWTIIPGGPLPELDEYGNQSMFDNRSYLSAICLSCYNRETSTEPFTAELSQRDTQVREELIKNHVCGEFNQDQFDQLSNRNITPTSEWRVSLQA